MIVSKIGGGASFVIHGLNSRMLVAGESQLFELTISVAELHVTQARIIYARRILQAYHLIIEEDSAMVLAQIQGCLLGEVAHPLLLDIAIWLMGCLLSLLSMSYRRQILQLTGWLSLLQTIHETSCRWMRAWPQWYLGIFYFLTLLNVFIQDMFE